MARGGSFKARLKANTKIKVRMNIPQEMKDVIKGKNTSKGKDSLEAEINKAVSKAVKESGLMKKATAVLNKEIAKKSGEESCAKKRRTPSKQKGPLVTTKHIDWKKSKKASGPVSATMNLGVTSSKAKDRVWAAAKLFYQIIANTPLDEDYEYTRKPKKSKEIKEKKAFKFVKGEDGLMKVVPVAVAKPVYKALHKADDKVTRNNWVLKITTRGGSCELHSGSLGINFDQPSDTGWTAVADQIRAQTGRFIPLTVDIENKDPYIDVLEYGRYNSTSTEKHQGAMYQHGTVGGYSVQAPRGIMRVAASQLNNLQLDADRESGGAITDSMLSAIPKVTLKLNSDNLADYSPVNEAIENAARTAEESGEFISERQMGELFMSDKPTVDLVIKRSQRAAKAANTRAFNKQVGTDAVAEALFKEVQKQSKVISRRERAENRALKEISGNQMSAVRAAGRLGANLDREVERELKIILKSQKTSVAKAVAEKKPPKTDKAIAIKENYYLFEIPGKDFAIIVEDDGEMYRYALDDAKYANYGKKEDFKKNIKFMKDEAFLKALKGVLTEEELYSADEQSLIKLTED